MKTVLMVVMVSLLVATLAIEAIRPVLASLVKAVG